jgi:hypothetical protein
MEEVAMTNTVHDARTADTNLSGATAAGIQEAPAVGSAGSSAPTSERIAAGICEWLLGLPMGVAPALLWVTGAALLGSCALVVYAVGWGLVGLVAGFP